MDAASLTRGNGIAGTGRPRNSQSGSQPNSIWVQCKFLLLFKKLSVLINAVNSCNVCVLYFCIFSNKLDLFQETYFIIIVKNITHLKFKTEMDLSFIIINLPELEFNYDIDSQWWGHWW
jgi:hypothetical protein